MDEEQQDGQEQQAPQEAPATGGDLAAELDKWKRLSRKNEAAAKAAQAKLDELAAGSKSEVEQVASQVAELQRQLAERDRELLRNKIVSELNVPAALAGRIQGDDEESMREDAQALVAALANDYAPKAAAPQEATGAGVTPKPDEFDGMDVAALMKASAGR